MTPSIPSPRAEEFAAAKSPIASEELSSPRDAVAAVMDPGSAAVIVDTLTLHAHAINKLLERQLAAEGGAAILGLSPVAEPPCVNDAFVPTRFDSVRTAPVQMTMTERVVLYGLVTGLRPQRVIEIGTHKGGSAMIIVAAMDDLGEGRLACVDPNPVISLEDWQHISHRTQLFKGCSPEVLPGVARAVGGRFSLALIDGDHITRSVTRDVEGLLPFLEDSAYLLFHDAHHDAVMAAISVCLHRHQSRLIDCGLISRERTGGTLSGESWGGLYLLRWQRHG